MKLTADELDDHLSSIGVTRDELELIGAGCLIEDIEKEDDWDDFDDDDDNDDGWGDSDSSFDGGDDW